MSRYPDDPPPKAPFAFRSNRPFVGGGPEWAPQTRALTRFGLGEADLFYEGNTWSEIKVLYDFYESVRGAAGRFTFVDFNAPDEGGQDWANLFVAKGDGITTTWDLPTFGAVPGMTFIGYDPLLGQLDMDYATPLILVNGSISYSGSYAVSYGTGTDGLDSLEATSGPPGVGIIISISATCRRAFRRARFTNAKNPFVYDVPDFYSAGPITIAEVRK